MSDQIRSLTWVGSSLEDLQNMPEPVQDDIGFNLHLAQIGRNPPKAKPLSGIASGIFEILSRHDTNTYRAVYAVKIGDKVYVLHCFQKKSKSGIATPRPDLNLIRQRYRMALEIEELETGKHHD